MARVFAGAGLVVAVAGFGAFVALGVAAWATKREVDAQVASLTEKAAAATDVVGRGLLLAREVIDRAERGLEQARAEAAQPVPPPSVNPFVTIGLRQATRELPGRVELARDAMVAASDAVVVAEAALNVLTENPDVGARFGVPTWAIQEGLAKLDTAAGDIRGARTVLGMPIPGHESAPIPPEVLRAVGESLAQSRGYLGMLDRALLTAREKIRTTRERTLLWAWRLAVGATVLAVLGATGMGFMGVACGKKLFRRGAA